MIELRNDKLVFSFPEVHPEACLDVECERTLRIPDDDRTHALPPGLGAFPLRHVDDHAAGVPPRWLRHGGVMMPMYQAEALWLSFEPRQVEGRATAYPFAVKIAAGKIDAVSGGSWTDGLHRSPQDYVVAPKQPWLDGFCVEKGAIRQFVAMPLGGGYSAEEQITGRAEHGGLQILVAPMKREVFDRRFPDRRGIRYRALRRNEAPTACFAPSPDMGLAPGGRMRQEIYDDPYDLSDWDLDRASRCFVHLANSMVWEAITGKKPPYPPPTAAHYTQAGLPWFDYYDEDATAIEGAPTLADLRSVIEIAQEKGEVALPENESVDPEHVVSLGDHRPKHRVREGSF